MTSKLACVGEMLDGLVSLTLLPEIFDVSGFHRSDRRAARIGFGSTLASKRLLA